MNQLREYRTPVLIGVGTLVVALVLWTVLIAGQNSKVSSLRAQETQLQGQQSQLQAKLDSLRSEKQRVPSSCADLQQIATQIPSVQSPTDVDAEESSFENQFNALTQASGVTLTQFSGFPTSAVGSTTTSTTTAGSSAAAAAAAANVVAVPTTLTVSGDYSQVTNFVNGLNGFPRLFVIQTFDLVVGKTPTGTSTVVTSPVPSASAGTGAATLPPYTATPLWTAGTGQPPGNGTYSLTIDGSIYYTTTPNALDACVKATEAIKKG